MPTVPASPVARPSPSGASALASGPRPPDPFLLMAAADMHSQGRLLEPPTVPNAK